MKLLIVENEKEQVQLYCDVIESYNKKNGTKIIPHPIFNLSDAKDILIKSDFDAAIIDLKLSSNSIELEGMEIVNSILFKLRFPVFIVSGSISQIEAPENTFFKKRLRDSDFTIVLKEITDIYNTGITNILGKRGEINHYLDKIFWNHLSESMDVWINDTSRTIVEKQQSLLRYTLLHIQEYLEVNESGGFNDYYPIEFYINPPIKKHPNTVFTADIFQEISTNLFYIVLTPSCDLVERISKKGGEDIITPPNASHITFCEIESLEIFEVSKRKTFKDQPTAKQLFHYMPPTSFYKEGGVINFSKVKSVQLSDVVDVSKYIKVLSVSNSFTKDIIARFSNYYARQGQPVLKQEVL
jgi:hypothetical protein